MPSAPINFATISTATIIPAPAANAFIRITDYLIEAAGATTVTFNNDGVGPLTGPFPMTAQNEIAQENRDGIFDLSPGGAFTITNAAAIQLSGYVTYIIKGF